MVSRGEVGLIVTTMGATTGIFGQTEVAVMVTVVLLTTLLTPVALRATYQLTSPQDIAEALEDSGAMPVPRATRLAPGSEPDERSPDRASFKVAVQPKSVPTLAAREIVFRNR